MASIEEWETLCINTTNVHIFLLVVDTNAIVYSQYLLLSIKQSRAHYSYSETEKKRLENSTIDQYFPVS